MAIVFAFCPHILICVDEVISISLLSKLPATTKSTLPYLVASVLFHWDWIMQNLSRNHPFFTSSLYTQRRFRDEWSSHVLLGKFSNPVSGLVGTGIPVECKILNCLQQIVEHLTRMDSGIPIQAATLMVEQLATVNGVTLHSRSMFMEMLAPITSALASIERRITVNERSINSPLADVENQNRYHTFEWGGEDHHYFPENFKLPVVTSVALWRLWLFGDDNTVNIPYRLLNGKHMSNSQRTQLSKGRRVMEYVRSSIGKTYAELTAEGMVEAERQFSEHYLMLMGRFKRHSDMMFSTAYTHILETSSSNSTDTVNSADSDVNS